MQMSWLRSYPSAQVAFHEDAVGQDVISPCAAYGARNSGDARKHSIYFLRAVILLGPATVIQWK